MLYVYKLTPKGEETLKEGEYFESEFLSCLCTGKEALPITALEIAQDIDMHIGNAQIVIDHYIQRGFITKSEGTYEDLEGTILRMHRRTVVVEEVTEHLRSFKEVLITLYNRSIRLK